MSQGLLGDPQSRAGINSPNRSFSASSGPSTPRSPGVTAFLREGSNWLYGGVFLSMFAGVIVLAILLGVSSSAKPQVEPFSDVVTTKLGDVKGMILADGTRQFISVPYGTIDKRFAPSRQVQPWSPAQKDCTGAQPQPICYQTPGKHASMKGKHMTEDCLFMNIYTPKGRAADALHGYPVMVWLHGGDFKSGSGSDFNGTKLVSAAKIPTLVVTINYRLGAFGFFASDELSKQDPSWPTYGGMNGVHDQMVALRWIKEHIHEFGGDHERITVFGSEAGAQSVCALMVSPWSRDLLRRAIMESGPCVGAGAPVSEADGLKSSQAIMDTLKAKSLADMRNAHPKDLNDASTASDLTWSIDEWIMPTDPIDLFEAGARGFNTIHVESAMLGSTLLDGQRTEVEKNVPTDKAGLTTFLTSAGLTAAQVTEAMTTYKLPATPAASDIKAAYRQIRADTCVTCPTKDLGVLISSIAYKPVIDTFMYRFAGPLGNATMGSEVDAVWGVNATKNGAFAFNVDLSNTMQDYWCACADSSSTTHACGVSRAVVLRRSEYANAAGASSASIGTGKDLWPTYANTTTSGYACFCIPPHCLNLLFCAPGPLRIACGVAMKRTVSSATHFRAKFELRPTAVLDCCADREPHPACLLCAPRFFWCDLLIVPTC